MLVVLLWHRFNVAVALACFLGFAAVVLLSFLLLHAWNVCQGTTSSERHRVQALQQTVHAQQVCLQVVSGADDNHCTLLAQTHCGVVPEATIYEVLAAQCQDTYTLNSTQSESAKEAEAATRQPLLWAEVRASLPRYSVGVWRNWLEVARPSCITVQTQNRKAD